MRTAWLAFFLAACSAPSVAEADLTSYEPGDPTLGRARRIFPSTTCQTNRGYLPYVYFNDHFPRVGGWVMMTANRASIPSPKDPPIQGGWLISHYRGEGPAFLQPFLVPGCQMMVRPDVFLFAAPRDLTKPLPVGGTMGAWTEGATAFLLLLPAPPTLGNNIYVQWMEFTPKGALTSHAVQLQIGDISWPNYRATLPRQESTSPTEVAGL
ncbi:MAG: hypothetical protein GY906_23465 [bacterium]|nr:hypothetical protein [bacterium]